MAFFNYDEVLALDKIQNRSLTKVLYHYWVNVAKDEEVKVLDTLQLFFEEGAPLSLTGRTDECLKLIEADIEKDSKELMEQFGGQIVLQTEDMTDTLLWGETGILQYISLRKSDEGQYLNDAMLLAFQTKDIIVFYDGDSVNAEEVFEEIDE
ncbi:MAG TPA: hypothetical protein VL947_05110 [Cytophagales bacterium]|nr:hypothetical protein [Cytophagales bacterium]